MPLRSDSVQPGVASPLDRLGPLLSALGASLIGGCVLFPGLGGKLLTNWDEGIYAEVARELATHSANSLTWNYQPWLEKPPLAFWATSVLYTLFGVHAFTARALSAGSGVLLLGIIHVWLRLRHGRETAWLGSLLLLATFGFQHICHVGELDTLLSLWATVSVIGLAELDGQRPSYAAGWWLFWAGFAGAVMTKGAAAVVLPLSLLLCALAGRWGQTRWGWSSVAGFAAFLAAVLPWHLLMWQRFGQRFLSEYLGYHVLSRALHPIESHPTHPWFFLWVVLISAAPFSLLLPWSMAQALRTRALRPWAIFTLVVVIFYSLVQTRLPQYVAPVYPALAVVNAVYLVQLLQRSRLGPLQTARARTLVGLGAVLLYGGAAAATAHARSQLHAPSPDGPYRAVDERGTVTLIRQVFPTETAAGTPLLLWRGGPPSSIAVCLFYAQRPVQQVELEEGSQTAPVNRYLHDPEPLGAAVAEGGRFLLADRALLSGLPQDLQFREIAGDAKQAIGWVERRQPTPVSASAGAPPPGTGTPPARR